MSSGGLLALVLLAAFGLGVVALSGLVALAWHLVLKRVRTGALDLLALRLLPSAGGLMIALAVVLPAFLAFEPHRERELPGPWLIVMAAFAAACIGGGIWRGARACRAARALLERCRPDPHGVTAGAALEVLESDEPLVAVIGAWRPRIVASEAVRSACDGEEFRAVLAHEAAHLVARDNLKLLLLMAAPDVLAVTPLAAQLTERWRAIAECDADQRATGGDSGRRLALASALIKVARLVRRRGVPQPALGMPVAADDVPGRVQALLGPPAPPIQTPIVLVLASALLLVPLLALPCYALLHELIELVVGLGR